MHTIRNVVEPSHLLLVWQDPDEKSRQRLVVGELRRTERGIELRYLLESEDFRRAQELGFQGHPAFKLTAEPYREGVLDVFLRRLPPRKRGDFDKYLEQFRLPTTAEISDFALLGYSGAKLPSDGFSLVHPFDDVDEDCELLLEVAGFRHMPGVSIEEFHVGQPAKFVREPTNPVDRHALQIVVGGKAIGYVNRIQLPAFHRWLATKHVDAVIERINGRPGRPLVYLFVTVREWPAASIDSRRAALVSSRVSACTV